MNPWPFQVHTAESLDRAYQGFLALFSSDGTPFTETQPAPPIPDQLSDKFCIWGYHLTDELFYAYEQSLPPHKGDLASRYKAVLETCERLGMIPRVNFVTGDTPDQSYMIWSRHFPTTGIPASAVPCAEKMEELRKELKFEVDARWYLHPKLGSRKA
ncbi:hypothetical protein VNI00_019151 [Paramarasmius palmivorus]|uniref:Uncharacterized protein n=1 Tax=Paramarasmius palmivorus TaxID=297713 RepID=A0AAW0ARN4_9AGAR